VIATIGGVATNTTTAVTSVEAGNGNIASATVTVVLPPSISKSFGAVSIPLGGTTTLTFKITNPNTTVTLTTVSFTDTLPAGLVVANPNGLTNTCGDAPVAVPGSNIIILTNGPIAPTATCTLAVNVQATAEANVTNSVTVTSVEGGTGNTATATLTIGAFSARYSVNLTQGDSVMHITNTGINGASLLGPGFGTAGNICVNVYAFSPDEQLISCCSCLVTPNALVSLSVNRDIIANTLTQVQPSSVVVKLVGTGAGTTFSGSNCTNSAPTAGTDGFPLAPGVRAWGTTMHQAIPGGAFVISETPFSAISLSSAELSSIAGRCSAVAGNGSGHGTCNSCRTGGL